MLNLDFSEDTTLLRDGFERVFSDKSSIAKVRAAEPLGFDRSLHAALAELGLFGFRVSEEKGGSAGSLMNAALLVEQAGRHLASTPVVESLIAARLLAAAESSREWLQQVISGEKIVTIALHQAQGGQAQLIPAGAAADAIIYFDGTALALRPVVSAPSNPGNLGSQPLASVDLLAGEGLGSALTLSTGTEAQSLFEGAIEEWKILTAAALNGLSRRSLEYAVEYARERTQFDKPIGSFQGVSHPLADRAADVDASQLFTWWAITEVANKREGADALIALAYWFSCKTADETTRRSIHTFGGYGVTLEYDVQLFFRRAKGWPLVLGDPEDQLVLGARRLWSEGAVAALPDAGSPELSFDFGEEAEKLADETRALLSSIITPEWRAKAQLFFEGYDPEINRQIGEAGLVHPSWPKEWGGRGAHPYAAALSLSTWGEYDVPSTAQSTAHFVGAAIMHSGSTALKEAVLLDIGRGLTNCSLGYSEPSSGSDVFAAKTRAIWDDEAQEWVINGQKMFTSGAEMTDYIFVVARTDPDAPKHAGVTMFLVPTNAKGVEVHAVHTLQDERTNATFFGDVRLPDLYRVGEVNGGAAVLASALVLEHGSGYNPGHHGLVDAAVEWARHTKSPSGLKIDDSNVLRRLGRAKVSCYLAEVIAKRAMYFGVNYPKQRTVHGPIAKVLRSENFQRDLADLIDLTAPSSLLHDRTGLGVIEAGHRQAQIRTIYGGTSEVHRSMIAEVGLRLPRSR